MSKQEMIKKLTDLMGVIQHAYFKGGIFKLLEHDSSSGVCGELRVHEGDNPDGAAISIDLYNFEGDGKPVCDGLTFQRECDKYPIRAYCIAYNPDLDWEMRHLYILCCYDDGGVSDGLDLIPELVPEEVLTAITQWLEKAMAPEKLNKIKNKLNKNNMTTMSKTKDEKDERWVQDLYRLSIETVKNLSQALSKATKEVQGDQTMSEMMASSQLYCDILPLHVTIGSLWMWRGKHNDKYRKMEWMELLKELYLRMQNFYKYGYVDNGNLTGIAWSIDKNGVFCLELRDCMVNMEHPFQEERLDKLATLFAIGLNMPLLESEDPEVEGSHLYGEYDEFVSFCCEERDPMTDKVEVRDIYPTDNNINEQAIRNILGSLDIISERNNKENE